MPNWLYHIFCKFWFCAQFFKLHCKFYLFLILLYHKKSAQNSYIYYTGGYSPKEDLVLLLEPARFKYPPFWITVTLLLEAMQSVDHSMYA